MISLGRIWWLFNRDVKRGFKASFYDYVFVQRILKAGPFAQKGTMTEVPVHLLTGTETFVMTCWMLASWFVQTQRNWAVIVHDDGSLNFEHEKQLKRLFGEVTVIWRKDSDDHMEAFLKSYPQCLAYRRKHPLGLKSFDIPVYAKGDRYIMLDSDVLFFKKPVDLLKWVDECDNDECWFNADAQEPAPITAEEAEKRLGARLWPKVNSGLCVLHKEIADFDFYETCLNDPALKSCKEWRIEQTLLALSASRRNKGGLLPATYEVSLGKWMQTDAIARHYVGAVRQRFYAEGVSKLAPVLLKRE